MPACRLIQSLVVLLALNSWIWGLHACGGQPTRQPSSGPAAADEPSTYNPQTVKDWFDATYFNLVVDYYTEVPQQSYGSGSTAENQRAAFELARPGYVIIYGKGHSGTTAFKSRLGTVHPMLGGDPLAVYRQVTRDMGVKLILYYSGLIDGRAAKEHPEWASAGEDGRRRTDGGPYRMVPICPSSRYLDDWVAVHLEEMITRYDPDGIWVDGDWAAGWRSTSPAIRSPSTGGTGTRRLGDGSVSCLTGCSRSRCFAATPRVGSRWRCAAGRRNS